VHDEVTFAWNPEARELRAECVAERMKNAWHRFIDGRCIRKNPRDCMRRT
jgi:hypothetical protein